VTRQTTVLAVTVAVAAVLLWVLPPAGLVVAVALLAVVPPWGRSLTERAVISGIVLLGVVAVVIPRAGVTPVTSTTARLLLVGLLVAGLALRFVPRLRDSGVPRPTLSDAIVGALTVASAWWLMAAYVGRSAYELVSGLFFTGWDNQGHFTTFANTYVEQSTTWPTVDGSTAWNQWYPSLQTTVMALAEQAWRVVDAPLDRPGLLWPYVQWNAILFALSLAALAWVSGDLAARLGGRDRERWTRPLAVAGFAAFALLGSPALLYNSGFTNFVIGVVVVVVAAYLGARSWRSGRTLGWFIVPLAAVAVIGLWTPLALGLVPTGLIVAIALFRHRRWMGVTWLAVTIAAAVGLGLTQLQAILGTDPEQSSADISKTFGSVEVGMSAFNAGMALAAPLIVVLLAILLLRERNWPLAVAVSGPVLGAALISLAFMVVTDSAGISRLQSYYVLKPMNAVLLSVAPIVAAMVAVGIARALKGLPTMTAALSVALAAVVVIPLFGYAGALPPAGTEGLRAAPGVQAGAARADGVAKPLIGEVIIRARDAAEPFPDDGTLLWDGAGTLPNLWVASLHGTLSRDQQTFYLGLPAVPYDAKTLSYVDFTLNSHPEMRLAVLWFVPGSQELLEGWAADTSRVTLVQVPMPANGACPECTS
jgi:hypothetical protein